jgi:hypothetical protein
MGNGNTSRIKVPPWWVFTVLALLVMGFALQGIKLPPATPPSPEGAPTQGLELRLRPTAADTRQDWGEEMALLDPTPLFLPTRWNSGGAIGLSALAREAGMVMEDYAPWRAFPDRRAAVNFAGRELVPDTPTDWLKTGRPARIGQGLALMRRDSSAQPLPERAGWIEAARAGTGEVSFAGPLRLPRDEALPAGLWRPVDFMAAVGWDGLVGLPTALTSSGDERMDTLLPILLARDLRLAAGLLPGLYRVTVGP